MIQLSLTGLEPPPQPGIPYEDPVWQKWFFFAWEALRRMDALSVINTFKVVNALDFESMRFAGEAYPGGSSIQDAVDAASPSGSVMIPGTYTGTDSYTNESNIPILDMRHKQLGIWSWIAPSFPVASAVLGTFPLGNDMVVMSRGPADTYISKQSAMCATASNLAVGANTVTVGTVTVTNARQGPTVTGTLTLFADDAGLFVGRGTPNEEVVTSANWTRNSATSITLTCVNAHTGPVDIEQIGTFFLTSPDFVVDAKSTSPPNATFHRMPIYDADRNIIGFLPYLPDAWPHAGVALNASLTGANGANLDLNFRMALSTSLWNFYDDTAGNIILQLKNNGDFAIGGGLTVNSAGLIATTTAFANGAGAGAGTITNAPTAGDPTKWIPIDDDGTTRYIPAW